MHNKNPQNIIKAKSQFPIHKQILKLFLSLNIQDKAKITINDTNNAYPKKDSSTPYIISLNYLLSIVSSMLLLYLIKFSDASFIFW